MWIYEKKLQFPVNIKSKDLQMAKFLFAQYGGPDSELSASQTYLAQRYTMPTPETKALLNDIGTEEMAHWEMLGTMIYQLTKDATAEEMREAGLGDYYATRGKGVFQSSPSGEPWSAGYIQVVDDPIANLTNDMAADVTTAKEQPLFSNAPRPLIRLAFRRFEPFCKNDIPAFP